MESSYGQMNMGRGRGVLRFIQSHQTRGTDKISPLSSTPIHTRHVNVPTSTVSQSCAVSDDFVQFFDLNAVPVNLITDIVKQIGSSIGQNIITCLETGGFSQNRQSDSTITMSDLSKVSLVVKKDVNEPPFFRGDEEEKMCVDEWVETVKVCLRKREVPLKDQADEVLTKLKGKARDVVKVGLISNPLIDLSDGPKPIFDLLKQHCSNTVYSCMPLPDFYATLPLKNEKPFDYWIRLHNAIDIAGEGLRRQGKTLDDPLLEVTVMFIRNCPDPELTLIFKCKPLEEWTAADVQIRLDEYEREKKLLQQRKSNVHVSGIACHAQSTDFLWTHGRCMEKNKAVTSPQDTEHCTQDQSLNRMISLLERVLDQVSCQPPTRVNRPQYKVQSGVKKQNVACEVCGDASHDTISHCRMNRLCFNCHAPGNTASACSAGTGPKPQVQQSGPDSGQLGN